MILPPLLSFLRPVGPLRFGYCLRVMQQFDGDDEKDWPSIEYERWGIQNGFPFDDGHVRRGYYLGLLPGFSSGVWRPAVNSGECWGTPHFRGNDSSRWCQPSYQRVETYYRLIAHDERGQMELFA